MYFGNSSALENICDTLTKIRPRWGKNIFKIYLEREGERAKERESQSSRGRGRRKCAPN